MGFVKSKDRSLGRATVINVFAGYVDVQAGGSPQLMRAIPVVGGTDDLEAGDIVLLTEKDGTIYAESLASRGGSRNIVQGGGGGSGSGMSPHPMSYHTDECAWHAGLDPDGSCMHDPNISEGPDIDIVNGTAIGRGGDSILIFDSGGNPLLEFVPTSSGLDAAGLAAGVGDVIWLPAGQISGDHTLADYVRYVGVGRHGAVLTGQITMGCACVIENCSITRTANSSDALKGLISPATGTSSVKNCDVTCTQSGDGHSYAVAVQSSGNIEVWDSALYGYAASGDGYGGWIDPTGVSGNGIFYNSRIRGSTGALSE